MLLRHAQYTEGMTHADHVPAQEGESELEEVEKEFQAKAKGSGPANGRSANGDGKVNQTRKGESSLRRIAQDVLSPVFVEAFVLTFLAEWGDRSQIATIGAWRPITPAGCVAVGRFLSPVVLVICQNDISHLLLLTRRACCIH